MKKLFIAGNWKMHFTRTQAVSLAQQLVQPARQVSHVLMLAVPFTALEAVSSALRGSNIHLGAQNVSWASQGAFTGEISAEQLLDLGVKYVLVGHSERREYFGETDQTVTARVSTAIKAGLQVVLCVGETLREKDAQQEYSVVARQLQAGLAEVSASAMSGVTVAYEPVWAIGTGKTALPDQAEDMHSFIRKQVAELYGAEIAHSLFIQYGGSVNEKNAQELLSKPNINGALVGGASLKADTFSAVFTVSVV